MRLRGGQGQNAGPGSPVRPGRGPLCAGADRRHQHPAHQKRLAPVRRGGGGQRPGHPGCQRRRPLHGRAAVGGGGAAQLPESERLVRLHRPRRPAHRRSVLRPGPSARAGTADLGRHPRARHHGRHRLPRPGRAAQKDPRHRKRHPRPAGGPGPQHGVLQVPAGGGRLHPQRAVRRAGQERIPRRDQRHHPRRLLHRRHRLCRAAGRRRGQRPHSAVPRPGGAGDRADPDRLHQPGGRHRAAVPVQLQGHAGDRHPAGQGPDGPGDEGLQALGQLRRLLLAGAGPPPPDRPGPVRAGGHRPGQRL